MLRRMLCVSYISGMSGNTFGKSLVLTTYGESHGDQIGGILDGMPSGIAVDIAEVQRELDRRKPGQSALTTARTEHDLVRFHSGIFEGKTTGTPIAFSILNKDQRSKDYGANLKKCTVLPTPIMCMMRSTGTATIGAAAGRPRERRRVEWLRVRWQDWLFRR